MKCIKCATSLQKEWNFCPKCGSRTQIMAQMNRFVKNIISNNPGAKVKVRIVRKTNPQQNKMPIRKDLKVIEPDSKILDEGDYKKLLIKLPGVSDPRSVIMRRVGKTIEVNAYSNKYRYFKIIKAEGKIISKSFRNQILTLIMQ